jgi:hypothetical protein
VLARVRISVPDRPGALGGLASAIGAVGADIVKVDVLENEAGRALDDVYVRVRDADHLGKLTAHLGAMIGVSVVGSQHHVPPLTGHADLELLGQVLYRPGRGLQTLVDGAPGALGADWGALVEYGGDGSPSEVIATSSTCPGPEYVALSAALRLTAVRIRPPGADEPYVGAVLVPLGPEPIGLVLVRETGPPFHPSELWRLGQIGQIIGNALSRAGST